MSEHYLYGGLALLALRSTIVLGCASVAMLFLRRRPAAERHLVWLLALVGVVILPAVIAVVPAWRVSVPALSRFASEPAEPWVAPVVNPTAATAASLHVTSGGLPVDAAASAAPIAGGFEAVSSAMSPRTVPSWPAAVVTLWLAGMLLVSAGTLLSMLHVGLMARRGRALSDAALGDRIRRLAAELGIDRPIDVLVGDAATMPMTFGVRRAALLLPSTAAGWPAARQDAVLRHELAHIRRRDSLAQLVADFACAIHWFNPLVWLAASRMRLEREHACDDVVLMAGGRASDYAAELLAVARATRVSPVEAHAALALARPSRLRTRLAAVLEDRARSQRIGRRRLLCTSALALAALVVVATATPTPVMAAAEDETAGRYEAAAGGRAAVNGSTGRIGAGTTQALASSGAALTAGLPSSAAAFEPPLPASGATQQATCWGDRFQGTGTIVSRDGSRTSYHSVQRTENGLELCMRMSNMEEPGSRTGDGEVRLDLLPVGGRIELAARSSDGSQDMRIVREPAGLVHTWIVNGTERAFDDTAREWRDAMLDVLNGYGRMGAIRGQVASLRGQVASVRGREASLRGEIASARGREASLRGQIASEQGREASLRGEIAALRGREASLRGEIAVIRSQRPADADSRIAAIERQITEHDTEGRVRAVEQRIRELQSGSRQRAIESDIAGLNTEGRVRDIEARIAQLDVAGEVRDIEARIVALDADRRVRELEAALEPQLEELRRVIQRIR